jgi:hypothetical protein
MNTTLRWALLILLLAVLVAQPALGFDYPFSPEAIREAYFLAKANPEKRQEFFEPYRHNLPPPKSGANVGLIEVETPFAFLVDALMQTPMDYHAADAEKDYLGKPGEFRVHVEIYFTDAYPKPTDTAGTLGEFWNNFQVHLKQDSEVSALSVHGQPIYSDDTISGYIGARIDADYDVNKIDSGALTTIEVDTPDGQQVETSFSLNSLR